MEIVNRHPSSGTNCPTSRRSLSRARLHGHKFSWQLTRVTISTTDRRPNRRQTGTTSSGLPVSDFVTKCHCSPSHSVSTRDLARCISLSRCLRHLGDEQGMFHLSYQTCSGFVCRSLDAWVKLATARTCGKMVTTRPTLFSLPLATCTRHGKCTCP